MSILLTGAAGYIGSNTAYTLAKHTDEDIIIVDNLATSDMGNITALRARCKDLGRKEIAFYDMDIKDARLGALFDRYHFDAIMHFAGYKQVGESVKDPLKYYENNIANALPLLGLIGRYGVRHFIFSSSAAVYGQPDASLIPIDEGVVAAPINPYGETKLAFEWLLDDVAQTSDMQYVCLRYFNVAGANSDNTMADLASARALGHRETGSTLLIKVAAEVACGKRDALYMYGDDYDTEDGTCVRDYLHIDDLSMAHLNALEYLRGGGKGAQSALHSTSKGGESGEDIESGIDSTAGASVGNESIEREMDSMPAGDGRGAVGASGVYKDKASLSCAMNVGYGHGYSVKEVIEMMKRVSGKDFKVIVAKRRAGDPAKLIANNAKIKALAGFSPRHDSLEAICRSSYEFEKSLS